MEAISAVQPVSNGGWDRMAMVGGSKKLLDFICRKVVPKRRR